MGGVSKDVVGTPSYKHALVPFRSLQDGISLELEKALLREFVWIEIVVTDVLGMKMKQRFEKMLVLVMLRKKAFAEPAFLGCQVQYLFVKKLTTKFVGKHFAYCPATATQLATNVYY